MEQTGLMLVGELARKMGVSVRTLQYYDQMGLLSPSGSTEGGRRLYSDRDQVRLHQILGLKHLGFSLSAIKDKLLSLETTDDVLVALTRQREVLSQQIRELSSVLEDLTKLEEEVRQMGKVDFTRYAYILTLLQNHNKLYWAVKMFDSELWEHIQQRFEEQPEKAVRLYESYEQLSREVLALKDAGVEPSSPEAADIARRWWGMVEEFTGGNSEILAKLLAANESKSGWSEELKARQASIDDYLTEAMRGYFAQLAKLPEGLERLNE